MTEAFEDLPGEAIKAMVDDLEVDIQVASAIARATEEMRQALDLQAGLDDVFLRSTHKDMEADGTI